MDKIQGGIEKLTNDDTRLTTAELTALQQAYNAMALGLVKTEFFISQTKNDQIRSALQEIRDEFLKTNLERPKRILEKVGVPVMQIDMQTRTASIPQTPLNIFRDEEILLDTLLSLQATVTGMQTGALVAVRGDVRDFFLNGRDAAFEQWRKAGYAAYKMAPQLIPPVVSQGGVHLVS